MTHSPTPRRRARARTRTGTEWQHPATERGYLLPGEAAALLCVSGDAFAAMRDRDWDCGDFDTPSFSPRPDR